MARTDITISDAYCRLPVLALGLAAGTFLAISFAICALFYVLFPVTAAQHVLLSALLPVFDVASWQGFVLGLASAFAGGWYVALIFGPLFNFFAAKFH